MTRRMAQMQPLPRDRVVIAKHMDMAEVALRDATGSLELVRDLLRRTEPARHVAVAITYAETAELWLRRAIELFPGPDSKPDDVPQVIGEPAPVVSVTGRKAA